MSIPKKESAKKIEVFIIDDDLAFHQQIRYAFRKIYQFDGSFNPDSAIEEYSKTLSPIVLLDLIFDSSKRHRGLELIPELREINPYVSIIVVTAHRSIDVVVAALKAGATDFLTKGDYDFEFWNNIIDQSFQNYQSFTGGKETYSKSMNFEIHEFLQLPLFQYFLFFKRFVEITKEVSLNFFVEQTTRGLQITFDYKSAEEHDQILVWFAEYINLSSKNTEDLIINFETDSDQALRPLYISELKTQVSHWKKNYEIAKSKAEILHEENLFIKNLSMKLLEQSNPRLVPISNKSGKYKYLKSFIANGRILEAMDEILSIVSNSNPRKTNQVLILRARLISLIEDHRVNVIKEESFILQKNKIIKALLEIIDDLELDN